MAKPKPPVATTFYKQPYESFIVGIDFSHTMEEGEELVLGSCNVTAVDKDGADVSSDIVDNTAKAVTTADAADITTTPVTNAMLATRIKGGTVALSKYLITYRVTTTLSNKYEVDLKLSVKEPSV